MSSAARAALLTPLLLGGCATSSTPPPDATTQFHNTYNYLPVNDVPHDGQRPTLSVEEQERLRKELSAVRDRQAPPAAKAGAAKPAGPKPAATSPAIPAAK